MRTEGIPAIIVGCPSPDGILGPAICPVILARGTNSGALIERRDDVDGGARKKHNLINKQILKLIPQICFCNSIHNNIFIHLCNIMKYPAETHKKLISNYKYKMTIDECRMNKEIKKATLF